MFTLTCMQCGKDFSSNRNWVCYCSERCQSKAKIIRLHKLEDHKREPKRDHTAGNGEITEVLPSFQMR